MARNVANKIEEILDTKGPKNISKGQISKLLKDFNKYERDLNSPKKSVKITLQMNFGFYTALKTFAKYLNKTPEELIMHLVEEGLTPPKRFRTRVYEMDKKAERLVTRAKKGLKASLKR